MERGFKYLEDIHGVAGAREIFEDICVSLFQEIHGPAAKTVRLSQGDGGIDVLVGNLPTADKIYQCKYFTNSIGSSQKQQIESSFETVVKNYNMNQWLLCLPTVLNQSELIWWSSWKNEKEQESNIKIELCDGSYLINNLKKYNLYNEIFDDDVRNKLDEILLEFYTERKKIIDEIIYTEDDIPNIDNQYNDFIFVKMLESANISDINACKTEFFNTEISKKEGVSKDEIEGMKVYNNLKYKIQSLWQSQYRVHKHQNDGNNLLSQTYIRIEDLDGTTLASNEEYNLLSKKGMLHHLANERKIGWIENYLEKLKEYMGEDD